MILVPHSQCSLVESPKFLQNFRPENNTLKENFQLIFLLMFAILIQACHLKIKTSKFLHKIGCISKEKISKNASELCE